MANIIDYLPELEGDEAAYVGKLLQPYSNEKASKFASVYRARRKDPQTVLLLTLIVFLGFGGINRFYLNQIGMGILYIFTAGLCLIGSVVDIINYKDLTFEYNRKVANEVRSIII